MVGVGAVVVVVGGAVVVDAGAGAAVVVTVVDGPPLVAVADDDEVVVDRPEDGLVDPFGAVEHDASKSSAKVVGPAKRRPLRKRVILPLGRRRNSGWPGCSGWPGWLRS